MNQTLPSLVCAIGLFSGSVSFALPQGRSWAAVDTFRLSDGSWLRPDRLDIDELGVPVVFAGANGASRRDTYAFRWEGSNWSGLWNLGRGVVFVSPVPTTSVPYSLLWEEEPNSVDPSPVVMAQVQNWQLVASDTVTGMVGLTFVIAGAVGPTRRWAATSDESPTPGGGTRMRIFSSAKARQWNTVRELRGEGDLGIAVAATDDTTALVGWGTIGRYGLHWAQLGESSWQEGARLDSDGTVYAPQFRQRPSGGQWAAWATNADHIVIAAFRSGAWSRPESIQCAYSLSDGYYSKSMDLSRDGGEYPAIAWSGDNARSLIQTVCVCIPTDSGFTLADNIADSDDGILPTVARDKNGDVWVAWWKFYDGMFWTHTYTSAHASNLGITGDRAQRTLNWTLSEPAAGTWWSIERRGDSGVFETVARVRAGMGNSVSWQDRSIIINDVAYRVRRESVDQRYEELSQDVTFRGQGRVPLRFSVVPAPFRQGSKLVLEGAVAGVLKLNLYDLQGRQVVSSRIVASGVGTDTLELDDGQTGGLAHGVYFLSVTDSAGQTSGSVRIILLR